MENKKYFFYVLIGCTILIMIFSAGYIIYDNSQNSLSNQDILENIVKNNFTSRNSSKGEVESSSLRFVERDYKFIKTNTEFVSGPAYSSCTVENPYSTQNGFHELYDYSDDSINGFYSKNIVKDSEGNILTYSLNNMNEAYVYNGGKYAVKNTFETVSSLPQDEATISSDISEVTSDDIELRTDAYFGLDSDIVEEDGDSYLVEWTYTTNCDFSFDAAASQIQNEDDFDIARYTIVRRIWANKETYEITKEEKYLNSVSDSNLIVTLDMIREKSNVDFSEVAGNFEFDLDVEVKEISFENESALNSSDDYISYLIENGLDYLRFGDNYELLFIYANNIERSGVFEYWLDRDFYRTDEQYDRLVEQDNSDDGIRGFLEREVSLSYGDGSQNSITVDIFPADITAEMFLGQFENSQVSNKTITINGQTSTVQQVVVENRISLPVEGSDSELEQDTEQNTVSSVYYTFILNGKLHVVLVTDISMELNFETLDPSISNEREEIKDIFDSINQTIIGNPEILPND